MVSKKDVGKHGDKLEFDQQQKVNMKTNKKQSTVVVLEMSELKVNKHTISDYLEDGEEKSQLMSSMNSKEK